MQLATIWLDYVLRACQSDLTILACRITAAGAQTASITPGSPWENGYIESFNARLRDEFINGEIF